METEEEHWRRNYEVLFPIWHPECFEQEKGQNDNGKMDTQANY